MNRLPTASTYAWLAAGAAVFIVYGSFVPFHYQFRPFDAALDKWRWVVENRAWPSSRSDWAANVLLGFPLAFCLSGARRCDRPGVGGGLRAGLFVWPLCLALACSVEFGQLYFPGRTSSLSDVLAQGLGAGCGVFAWVLFGQRVTDYVRGAWDGPRVGGTAGRLLFLYLLALAFVQALPLDVTTSPGDWYRKWKDGGVVIEPFADAAPGKWVTWLELAGLYLPAGLLAAGRVGRSWSSFVNVVLLGLAVAVGIELLQWPVSRTPSVSDALVGAAAVVLGWAVGRAVHTGRGLDLEAGLILGQAWMLLLLAINWAPFDFHGGIGAARLHEVNWVPFALAEQQNPLLSLRLAAERVLLAAPLGGIVAAIGAVGGRGRVWLGVFIAAGVAAVIELGQLFLPSKFCGPTDLVYAAFGAWLGGAAVTAVRTAAAVVPEPVVQSFTFVPEMEMEFDIGRGLQLLPPEAETPPPAMTRTPAPVTVRDLPDLLPDDDGPIHVRLTNSEAEDTTT